MIRRRQLLVAGAAAMAGAGWGGWLGGPAWAQNAPDLGTPTLPENGVRRIPLGDAELLAVHDGIARRPLAEGFVRNASITQVKAALVEAELPTDYLDVSFTAFLLVTKTRRILMDTGNGEFGAPTTGRLLANLARAGISPDSIDTVLITHFHGDHINGLRRRDGSWVFPKAQVMVPAGEWAFWMDDERMAAAPEGMKPAFQGVRRVFAPVAAQVRRFEPDTELMPGLRAVAAHGHTPGMSMFEVQSRDQRFLFVADLTNVPALFMRQPDWAVQFDMDPEAARLTRRKVLEAAASEGTLVGGYHFPFPAVGKVLKDGEGYDLDPYRTT
ncbi:MAG: MBL fold metallo-hydrolase [Ideonella sp.]|nr:MBL fold metallo-hydrolase [Ideonella sp.]